MRHNIKIENHFGKEWYQAKNPNAIQASAKNALDIAVKCGVVETKLALRDEVFTIMVPHLGLLYDMFTVRTKDGEKTKSYTLSDLNPEVRPHHVLFRIFNGELYVHTSIADNNTIVVEERIDTYAWTDEEYANNLPLKKRKLIGVNSKEAREVLELAIASLANPRDKVRLESLFKMYAIDFECGVQVADWRQVIEVTQKLYDAGLTSIVDDYSSTGEATNLVVGDFLVVTEKGMYRIDRATFVRTHTTFTQYA